MTNRAAGRTSRSQFRIARRLPFSIQLRNSWEPFGIWVVHTSLTSDRMVDMPGDDFYVDDETPEQVRAAIKRGKKGETVGKKDLDQRARSITDQAVARFEAEHVDHRPVPR